MRRFWLMLLAVLVISTSAWAKDFEWVRPGANPYRGTKEQAIPLLARGLVPPQVVAKLRAVPCRQDTLADGLRITRMTFGNGSTVSNVIARTSQWPGGATQIAEVCEYEDRAHNRLYVLLRPDICNNWSVIVLTLQGQCITDKELCDKNCSIFKEQQQHPH